MTGSALQEYARGILGTLGGEGGGVVGIDCDSFGPEEEFGVNESILGLILLDTMVLIRYLGYFKHGTGHSLGVTLDRICHGSELTRIEAVSNVAVFAPL